MPRVYSRPKYPLFHGYVQSIKNDPENRRQWQRSAVLAAMGKAGVPFGGGIGRDAVAHYRSIVGDPSQVVPGSRVRLKGFGSMFRYLQGRKGGVGR